MPDLILSQQRVHGEEILSDFGLSAAAPVYCRESGPFGAGPGGSVDVPEGEAENWVVLEELCGGGVLRIVFDDVAVYMGV